jgi:glycosyltransferase involved in cell wall biosynthesis
MNSNPTNPAVGAYVSVAIFAWNEEDSIASTLYSLFEQTFFWELSRRNARCEVICVVNGSSDRTAEIAAGIFAEQSRQHPYRRAFQARVVNLAERGKLNAWNQFVHSLSAAEARFLLLMDADIRIHRGATLWNMLTTLEQDQEAHIAVDRPCKDIEFKRHKSLRERLSLAASELTQSAEAQLCAQLYCIRSNIARNIYLPKDLAACEDGFIKALVCTDFLLHEEAWPRRIRLAEAAAHTFEAYVAPMDIVKNQKRQLIGQTIVHVLVDDYLRCLPEAKRESMAETLRQQETADPLWLKRRIAAHLQQVRHFWRLYPGLLSQRFKRLGRLSIPQRLRCFPAAAAGSAVALLASYLAYRTLKSGCTDYWPQARRLGLKPLEPQRASV